MEKKILLLFIYIVILFYIKQEKLMTIEENRGFYIDIIIPSEEEILESTYCEVDENVLRGRNEITS